MRAPGNTARGFGIDLIKNSIIMDINTVENISQAFLILAFILGIMALIYAGLIVINQKTAGNGKN